MVKIIEEREFEDGIALGQDGHVIYNAFQADDPMIRRKYDDGTVDLVRKSTGQPILERYDPETQVPKCRHCGKAL